MSPRTQVVVRERTEADHEILRYLFATVRAALTATTRDEGHRPQLIALLGVLRTEVERHLDFEDIALLPVLHVADAWGPVRVARLAKDHGEQRALVRTLHGVAATEPVVDLAQRVAEVLHRLEADMAEEEGDMEEEGDRRPGGLDEGIFIDGCR
jgi:hypothetical protein